jgi:hypothetical protein
VLAKLGVSAGGVGACAWRVAVAARIRRAKWCCIWR